MIQRSAVLTAAVLSCGLLAAAVLMSSAGAQSSGTIPVSKGPVTCVEQLIAIGPADAQGDVPAKAESQGCFQSRDAAVAAIAAAGTVHIGKDWWNSHQEGDSLIWTGNQNCTNNQGYQVGVIGDAWDNEISSSIGKNGCNRFKHFEGVYFSGSLIVCTLSDGPCWEMGAMNDNTTSLKFHHE